MDDKWQPIETAPRDGSRILLYGDGEIEIARYVERDTFFGNRKGRDSFWEINVESSSGFNYHNDFFDPTDWQPLPDFPIRS